MNIHSPEASNMMHVSIKRMLAGAIGLAVCGRIHAAELTVSAAASLTNAFKEVSQSYEAKYAGSKVLLNVGASGALLQQIAKGAPVDVFASADQETMDQAEKQGLVSYGERKDFVRNTLVLVVPTDSKLALKRLEDLDQAAVQKIAIGNPASVPVGRYSQTALEAAKLWTARVAQDLVDRAAQQLGAGAARGEVDAGFVYATDAALMKDKVRIAMDVPLDVAITYPVATLAGSAHGDAARQFVAYVLSPAGQAILGKYGFQKP